MDSLTNLKIAAILIAGLFALVTAVYNFKTANGTTTTLGKIILGIAIFGVVIAAIAQFLDSKAQNEAQRKAEFDSLKATERLERIISDLNRSLQTIESFEVWFLGNPISLEEKFFDEYKKITDKAINKFMAKPRDKRLFDRDLAILPRYIDDKQIGQEIEFTKNGKYAPGSGHFKALAFKIMPICYTFSFFKNPVDPYKFRSGVINSSKPDLRLQTIFIKNDMTLQKIIPENTYSLSGSISIDKKQWQDNSGKIISIPDLAGSQLFFDACTSMYSSTKNKDGTWVRKPSTDIRFAPGSMKIKIGSRSFWIDEKSWTKHPGRFKNFWEYRFPDNIDLLWNKDDN